MHDLAEEEPEFTLKELEVTFRSLNQGKAPGRDGIPLAITVLLFKTKKAFF